MDVENKLEANITLNISRHFSELMTQKERKQRKESSYLKMTLFGLVRI